MPPTTRPAVLDALRREAAAAPYARKLLLCRRGGEGRELLRALARSGTSWIGFEAATPGSFAHELVAASLAADELRVVDELDARALVDAALDEALVERPTRRLAAVADTVGFRDAIYGAVTALRIGAVAEETVRAVRLGDAVKADVLAGTLARYERGLARAGQIDSAGVLARAIRELADGLPAGLEAASILLVPGLHRRGLVGRLIARLEALGASLLDADPTGAEVPPRIVWPDGGGTRDAVGSEAVELFVAASPAEEVREILRRALGRGARWDEVEIVATDAAAYGAALDSLARRLEIPVSYATGLPIERTRPGRALAGYLAWIEAGYPASALRRLLESGDVAPPAAGAGEQRAGAGALARRLGRLGVGWGSGRYLVAIERALAELADDAARVEDADDEESERRRTRARDELLALRALLEPLLAAAPQIQGPLNVAEAETSAAQLARAGLIFLACIGDATPAPVDALARLRLSERLERIAATLDRRQQLPRALAVLRSRLELRLPAPEPGGGAGPAPWRSSPGRLHFADIEHGGLSGRPHVFVVGLDSGRFPPAGIQDALLTDADRAALGGELPSTAERLEEVDHALRALLARLRGRVTLSYSGWDAAEGRTVAPSAALLDALRVASGDPAADYERLRGVLGRPVSAVPTATRLDGRDVWLGALHPDGRRLEGTDVVRAAFPGLDAGLTAAAARRSPEPGPHHGVIRPRPGLDPRDDPAAVLSAHRLQTLGTCPLRYFYRYVLHLTVPDEVELASDRWLDPRVRGGLLHAVYEVSLRRARAQGIALATPAFDALIDDALDEAIAHTRRIVPTSGEAIVRREVEALRADAATFARMVRELEPDCVEVELAFGFGAGEPVRIDLPGGAIQLGGRIDRIDRLPDGRLVVVDYKTGAVRPFRRDTGVFDGGRRLQHALYARVAEQLLGQPVARVEYHFPTRKGRSETRAYDAAALRPALPLIDGLLDMAATGRFLPTPQPEDCRFCDYAAICRAGPARYDTMDSPPAEWAAERVAERAPIYDPLRAARDERIPEGAP